MFARIRAAWRAFWTSTAAVIEPEPIAQARALGVSPRALFESEVHGARVFLPEQTFSRPEPLPGVVPAMAMDSLPALVPMAAQIYGSYVSEGLGFLGYPYLSELSQRAEYRKIASIWAEHCTRKWIKLTGDADKVERINQELERLDVQATFRTAIERECFFGRVQLFLDFGDWDRDQEIATQLIVDPAKINRERPLQRIALIEPMWCYPGRYSAQNPLAPDFYKPSDWYVSGRTVHASRLLTMVGHEMPVMLKPAYAFGGVSLTQMCKPYVDNWLRTRQSVSDLVHAFSVMVLKTDMEQVMGGGAGDPLFRRIDLFNKTRDNRGTFAIDKNSEDFTNVSAPVAGLDKLLAQAQEQMSSVSGIPLVVLLGITPSGLNASSEGEIRIFYDAILSYCEKVCRPELETLLDVVQLSLFGEIDQKIGFEFLPLWEMSDKDKADIRKSDAEADAAYITNGVVDPEETRKRLNDEDGGMYHGLLTGPAPEPPEQEMPGLDDGEGEQGPPFGEDGWSEGDHPRDDDGRFAGGGSVHSLTGTEIAPEDVDAPTLRAAARSYFETHLRGKKVESAGLGHEVRFSTKGFKEAASWSAHPDKLRLFPAVPDVIEHGVVVKSEPPSKPRKGESASFYHTIEATVTLRGEVLTMQVVVRQDANGSFHYDHWALEHRKGPATSGPTPPNPKSGEQTTGDEAVSGHIADQADSINIYFRRGV